MLSELRIKIIETKELSYSQAAKETGLNKGEIWRAVNKGIYPRAKWKREALGLPCLTEVPVCPIHGEAHTVSCPSQRKKRKPPPAMTEAVKADFSFDCYDVETMRNKGFDIDLVLWVIENRGYRLVRRKGEGERV